jgi:uncharacterized protein YacL
MYKTIVILRIFFFLICITGSYLVCYSIPDWDQYRTLAVFIGANIGILVILIDVFLKGFSLRGLTALTFGLFVGWLFALFISSSPLFENGDPQILFLVRLSLFVILMYLGAVIALRGRDEFNLVIPYVRFEPHGVDVPLVVLDTSILIDGRIIRICESKFMGYALVIPRFVLDELQRIADSSDVQRQTKGRKGLEVLNQLRKMKHLDLRIHESDVSKRQNVDAKLVFLAQSMNAKIMTTNFNLAQMAEFHTIDWLNINALAKALNPDFNIGEIFDVELVKEGKEPGQAVGFLNDGSMVVVNDGNNLIGQSVRIEVQSILPSAGGKMVFAKAVGPVETV